MERIVALLHANFGTCRLDVLELAELASEPSNVLSIIGMMIFEAMATTHKQHRHFQRLVDLKACAKLLRHIETRYPPANPFHNCAHAADVMHSMFVLLNTTRLGQMLSPHCLLAALLAAVMHDIDHLGVTNEFLVRTHNKLATQFPTSTPMECMHAAVATQLVCSPKYRVLSGLDVQQQAEALLIIQQSILATALVHQDLVSQDLQKSLKDLDTSSNHPHAEVHALSLSQQRSFVSCVLHLCDLGHAVKPFAIHRKWVERLQLEGERQRAMDPQTSNNVIEKCPLTRGSGAYAGSFFSRELIQGQLCFLRCFVVPALDRLYAIRWLQFDTQVLQLVTQNVNQWQTLLAQLR